MVSANKLNTLIGGATTPAVVTKEVTATPVKTAPSITVKKSAIKQSAASTATIKAMDAAYKNKYK